MFKHIAIIFTVLGMASVPAFSQDSASTQSNKPGPTVMEAILKNHAALLSQCPVVPTASKAEAEAMPINITTWGETGPSVFFVHGGVQGGIGGGPSNFAGQQPLSMQGWRLNLIDRPGFGQSPSRGPDDMEADAAWIVQKIGDSSHLVGHSFGGAEVLLAAALRPQAVRSLILVEPALQPMLATDPESLQNPDAQAGLQIVSKFLISARTPAEFAASFAHSLGSGEDGGTNPSAAALDAHPERATVLGCSLLRARMASPATMRQAAEIIANADIPVLVISGGYSPGQDATGEIIAKLTHGRHVIVHAPNHFVQQFNPEEFNKVVDAFMREADRNHDQLPASHTNLK